MGICIQQSCVDDLQHRTITQFCCPGCSALFLFHLAARDCGYGLTVPRPAFSCWFSPQVPGTSEALLRASQLQARQSSRRRSQRSTSNPAAASAVGGATRRVQSHRPRRCLPRTRASLRGWWAAVQEAQQVPLLLGGGGARARWAGREGGARGGGARRSTSLW